MLFTTIDFIVFFIFVMSTIIIIKNRKFQHLFLLIASYFFFYYSSNYLLLLLIFSTLLDFYVGKEIWKATNLQRKKILLIISLVGNLGLLGFFKYTDFVILQFNIFGNYFDLNSNLPFLNLVLPIGISFYTFQTISYTLDIYRGNLTPSKSLREFALYVTFFSQLVAGPIVRAKDFLPQLREKLANSTEFCSRRFIVENSNFKLGITFMTFGFLKKMFFADNIAPMVDIVFNNPMNLESFTIIIGTIGFAVQAYGDFSGYSDIAIGAALIFGIKIPKNFNKPYFATSPSDFWRRWHISLSSWVRDYLFLPIVLRNVGSDFRLIFGVMITFLLLGLWHGAGWNFIIFGLIHAIYVVLDNIIRKKIPNLEKNRFFKTTQGRVLSILGTQYLVFFSWIAFRVKDMESMLYSMEKFVFWDFAVTGTIDFLSINKFPIFLIILFFGLNFISYKKSNLHNKISNLKLPYWFLFLLSVFVLIVFFYDGSPDFMYFQF